MTAPHNQEAAFRGGRSEARSLSGAGAAFWVSGAAAIGVAAWAITSASAHDEPHPIATTVEHVEAHAGSADAPEDPSQRASPVAGPGPAPAPVEVLAPPSTQPNVTAPAPTSAPASASAGGAAKRRGRSTKRTHEPAQGNANESAPGIAGIRERLFPDEHERTPP